MGVNLKDIVVVDKISFQDLNNKIIAIDAYNAIYQFLSIIRQFDGKPLVDRNGNITSHLSGLFYRTINLMEYGIKPVYIFDGKPHALKSKTLEARSETRSYADKQWREALLRRDFSEAKKYAQASSRLSESMVEDAKRLLSLMGVPYVVAPSEGEAQAAYMNSKGVVWACGSQDWDALLFGCVRLIRNLTLTGRRKLPGKAAYIKVEPELADLNKVLRVNEITREQLVDVAILVGTDFNEGVKGVGAKTALKLVSEFGCLEELIKAKKISLEFDFNEVRQIFLNPNVTDDYNIDFGKPVRDSLIEYLHGEHDFSIERVNKAVDRLDKLVSEREQPTLDDWFKS